VFFFFFNDCSNLIFYKNKVTTSQTNNLISNKIHTSLVLTVYENQAN